MKRLSPICSLLLVVCGMLAVNKEAVAQQLYHLPENAASRMISFENATGAPGQGGLENNGAKGHATETIEAGGKRILADYSGSGIVQRIWCTVSERTPVMLRSLRLQLFWDDATSPAVDVPLGDFFGIGLGQKRPFESAFFSDPEGKSFNCFIPMPFRQHVKMVFLNESAKPVNLFYDIDLLATAQPDTNALYFHAYWNRAMKNPPGTDYEILPAVQGKGRFLGTNIGVITDSLYGTTWWGEGEVKMYIDSDSLHPTINGTGTEDYVGAAWGLGTFNHQYQGCLVADGKSGYYAFYRYHVPDVILFSKKLKVTIQEIGGTDLATARKLYQAQVPMKPVVANSIHGYLKLNAMPDAPPITDKQFQPGGVLFYRSDDYSSTAYFYLDKPANSLPALPGVEVRTVGLKAVN